jgi:hypothetical protein
MAEKKGAIVTLIIDVIIKNFLNYCFKIMVQG